MRKKIIVFLLTISLLKSFLHVNIVFASQAVNEVDRVDISSGTVISANSNYSILLPNSWKTLVYADREVVTNNKNLNEKINFYCSSSTGLYKPKLLMTLYVYHKDRWSENLGYTKVLSSNDFVFAVKLGKENPFSNKNDNAAFSTRYAAIDSVRKISLMIKLGDSQKPDYEEHVFIDGEPTNYKIVYKDNSYFVPLRATCEDLGFIVTWIEKTNQVVIEKGNFHDTFVYMEETKTDNRNIRMEVIDGRTYVAVNYFLRILNKNLEIDNNKNVFIYSN